VNDNVRCVSVCGPSVVTKKLPGTDGSIGIGSRAETERLPDRLGVGLVLQPTVLLHPKQP